MSWRWGRLDTVYGPAFGWADPDGAIKQLYFAGARDLPRAEARGDLRDDRLLEPLARQLAEYSNGRRRSFDLELKPEGTPFQLEVWKALVDIPFGETTSYGALAATLGRPAASRAVGAANGANPIMLVVPCHRVIGSTGSLTGFGGGLPLKACMLDFERRHASAQAELFA